MQVSQNNGNILSDLQTVGTIQLQFFLQINLATLDVMARYSETLTSIMWVDSLCHDEFSNSWKIIKFMEESDHMEPAAPDPFVILSWVCKKLEEIILLGKNSYIQYVALI